jgi:NADPH:quinone reductase-like Zn-dependent oxidoreductase
MRAWRIHTYGGPQVLRFEEAPDPLPAAGELLVRVHAASVNPADWKLREGLMQAVMPTRFPRIPGRDCAGIVEAVCRGVTAFHAGDRVHGVVAFGGDGTHAELAVLPAAQAARVPDALPLDDAAALGTAALSAYIPLVEVIGVKPGDRLLIHAGAGGVGSLAIQIARHLGAEVLATCSARNADYCRALGADRTIDYSREDFVAAAIACDAVLDTMGGEVHTRSAGALRPGGTLVYLSAAPIATSPARPDVRVARAAIRYDTGLLTTLLDWAARGILEPQIGATFPLAEALEAYALSQSGHSRGRILLCTG